MIGITENRNPLPNPPRYADLKTIETHKIMIKGKNSKAL